MTGDPTHRRLRWLAGIALGLAAAASFAGSPYTARHASIDVALLAHTVEQEEDHVTALELAEWIKERRPGLRVLDVRTPEEYQAYHVPTAEHLALDSLTRMPFRADETLVLYSEGGAHAAQVWVFLRALGYRKVFFLRGGLYEWLDQVMNPRLADTTVAARGSFARASVISRYFGGVPRSDMPRESGDNVLPLPQRSRGRTAVPLPAKSTASTLQEVRRRGC
ncbi:MAG: rhodanese-like domain-containing protein [Gemmatimonadaceae bacterium]